jgi:pimeloyl-ACP methyl ester carboxylesterase
MPGTMSDLISSSSLDLGESTIHYLRAGDGPGLLLLHGYTQTSHMWRPIIPVLAERFTVIAPDLPAIGESSIPSGALDMSIAAEKIHELVQKLGLPGPMEVVGHDIGLMVAYAYAAKFSDEVKKLAVMDAFLPGVGNWGDYYNDPKMWHFRFNGPTPEALVSGRERIYYEHYWNNFAADKNRSLSEADREFYTASYARPGRMRAAWAYFVSFPETAKQFARLAEKPLTMPVLSISGEKSGGDFLPNQMKLVAVQVTAVILKDSGHWVMEEKPQETMDALIQFL